ncbi:MAG: anti-sigma factor family protein [Bacteroidota bacterium]
MTQNHPPNDTLQLYVDGELDAVGIAEVRQHLNECPRCESEVRSLVLMSASLKTMPLEKTSAGFTRNVLGALQLAPKSPLMFRLLEKAGYFMGLVMVLGLMLGAFTMTGVIQLEQVQQGVGYAGRVFTEVDGTVSGFTSGLTAFLTKYMPFAFGKGSVGIVTFSLVFLALLAVADKLFGGKVQHRLR